MFLLFGAFPGKAPFLFLVPDEQRGERRERDRENDDVGNVLGDGRNYFPLVSERVSETGENPHVEDFSYEGDAGEFPKWDFGKTRKDVYGRSERSGDEPARENGGRGPLHEEFLKGFELRGFERFFQTGLFENPPAVLSGYGVACGISNDAGGKGYGQDVPDLEIPLGRERSGRHDDRRRRERKSDRSGKYHAEEQRVFPNEEIGEKEIEHGG